MAAVLALSTSLTYGLSNYIGPRLARGVHFLLLLVISQGCSLALSVALLAAVAESPPDAGAWGWSVLAGAGNAAGLIFFYAAAQAGPLSVVMPIGSVGIAVPVALGLASGESITTVQAAGMVLAVSGVVLVARRPPGGLETAHHAARQRAVVLALLSAVGFGVFLAAIKLASEESAPWAVAVSRFVVVLILVVAAAQAGVLAVAPRSPRRLALLSVPGVLLFAGTIAYAAATRLGDLTVVSVLGSLFTVVTVALAVTLDHERLSRLGWAGVGAAVAGVVLLSVH